MFKHILLPTDGSQLSESAALECIQFAKILGAKVTALHVTPEFHVVTYRTDMLADTKERFDHDCALQANQYLAKVEKAAKEAGVACDTLFVRSDHPHDAIVTLAVERECDLIGMASHGRKGMEGFLIGSETQKVLAHSKIPVLVFH